jgi:hypothetical protein
MCKIDKIAPIRDVLVSYLSGVLMRVEIGNSWKGISGQENKISQRPQVNVMTNFNEDVWKASSRREFLASIASVGMGVAALGLSSSVDAATTPQQPAADTGHAYPFPSPHANTEKEFREAVIPIATLSHLISEFALDRATRRDAKEFANFELRETIAVLAILKAAGTPVPPFDATIKSILASVKSAKGTDFDKAYIGAELAGHEYLRDLAESYLTNSAAATSPGELHVRDLASLSLVLFKEHVVLAKDIKGKL